MTNRQTEMPVETIKRAFRALQGFYSPSMIETPVDPNWVIAFVLVEIRTEIAGLREAIENRE